MKTKKSQEKLSSADIAVHDLVRVIPQKRIDEDLMNAIDRARLWYKLNHKRFRMPKTNR